VFEVGSKGIKSSQCGSCCQEPRAGVMLPWIVCSKLDKKAAQTTQSAFDGCSGGHAQVLVRGEAGAISMEGEI